jgi:hypothetical protein
MYPTDCIISVKDLNTKEKLISGGITLKNRSVNFLDVEKTITNVTIKDAPYEAQFMIWRYLEPFSIFVPLMYPLRTDPGITSPYFIICVAI